MLSHWQLETLPKWDWIGSAAVGDGTLGFSPGTPGRSGVSEGLEVQIPRLVPSLVLNMPHGVVLVGSRETLALASFMRVSSREPIGARLRAITKRFGPVNQQCHCQI